MLKMIVTEKLNSAPAKAVKILLEYCKKEKIENPMLLATIGVSDGSRYKLTFERVDLEEKEATKRVRFFPTDTDETFDGTVIDEKSNFYVVIPDQNRALRQNWNKKRCKEIALEEKEATK